MTRSTPIRAREVFCTQAPYAVPKAKAPVDLPLDGNEGRNLLGKEIATLIEGLDVSAYPSAASLEALIAQTPWCRARASDGGCRGG